MPLYQRALKISEKVSGSEHPSTADNLNNLAVLYQAMGAYEKALPRHRPAWACPPNLGRRRDGGDGSGAAGGLRDESA
jgi:hypothetical protein